MVEQPAPVKHPQQTVAQAVQVAPARLVLRNHPLVAVVGKAGMALRLLEGEVVALPPPVLRGSMAAVVVHPT